MIFFTHSKKMATEGHGELETDYEDAFTLKQSVVMGSFRSNTMLLCRPQLVLNEAKMHRRREIGCTAP